MLPATREWRPPSMQAGTSQRQEPPHRTDPRAAERLWEAARKALHAPRGHVALVLHLSNLSPPAPRGYHRRLALAMLDDAAHRCAGQVFLPPNGDAVLLCRLPASPPQAGADLTHPNALPHTLSSLFRVDVAEPAALITLWNIEHQGEALLAYASAVRSG